MADDSCAASSSSSAPAKKLVVQSDFTKEDDLVILFQNYKSMTFQRLTRGTIFNNRFGGFRHDDMIGRPFGSRVFSFHARPDPRAGRKGRKRKKPNDAVDAKGWLILLKVTPELWTLSLNHRTQILYHPDISMIVLNLELQPGCFVVETGTGSGSLSTSMARAIGPSGHVHTFDFNEPRVDAAKQDFERLGISDVVTVHHRDTIGTGLPNIDTQNHQNPLNNPLAGVNCLHEGQEGVEPATVDAVFLDVPAPWEVVRSSHRILKAGGMMCSFSPCIEQVQRTAKEMARLHFINIETVEVLAKFYNCQSYEMETANFGFDDGDQLQHELGPSDVTATKAFSDMRGHTGYLTFARKPVADAQ